VQHCLVGSEMCIRDRSGRDDICGYTRYPQPCGKSSAVPLFHTFIHISTDLSTSYPQTYPHKEVIHKLSTSPVDKVIHNLIHMPVDSPVRASSLWTYLWICTQLSTEIALISVDNHGGTVDNPSLDTHPQLSTALSTTHNSSQLLVIHRHIHMPKLSTTQA
jgi:hypothetical protein